MKVSYVVREVRSHGLALALRRRGVNAGSARAMANWALNAFEERQGRTWLRSNPPYVQIEPTTACNLGCTMCGRQSAWEELRRNSRYLPWEVFMKTLSFLRTARYVALHGWGESLVHPELPYMADVCKRAGAVVDVTTNGLLLGSGLAKALVDRGVDTISVSLEGATEGTYAAIRGGDLRVLVDNLEGLAEIKRRAGKKLPFVRFVFCIMKQNFRELPLLVDLAHRCGVGEISVNNLIVYRPELAGQSVFDLGREVEAVHEEALRSATRLGLALIYKGIKPLTPKPSCAFGALAVLCDGSVGFCGAQRVLTGNIHDDTLRNLWNAPPFQTARRRYATRDYPETCRRCPNHTNSREDHETPDMSYVAHTLAVRQWGRAEKSVRRLPMAGAAG